MAIKPLPEIEFLRKILRYECSTGKLIRLERSPDTFEQKGDRSLVHSASLWNSRHCGKEAMTAISKQGYKVGNINNSLFRAHRIAWAIHYGYDPKNQIDHINGDRQDNRIENLRIVTNQQNSWNQKMRSTNKSGINGVSWCKMMNKWVARAMVDGIDHRIGYFDSKHEAAEARARFDRTMGFHANHGIMR